MARHGKRSHPTSQRFSRGGQAFSKKNPKQGKQFWDKEYAGAQNLALSTEPSEDVVKFTRFLERHDPAALSPDERAADLGCGNGRNLVHLARTYGIGGAGFDISQEAIAQARSLGEGLHLSYEVRSLADPVLLTDESHVIVIDAMASHVLPKAGRDRLRAEEARILKPNGWLFLKTFLREGDLHAERMLRDHPASEDGSYIHPKIGIMEHVYTEEDLAEELAPYFEVVKTIKSYRHRDKAGRAFKRRSIVVYARKNG